MFLDAANATKPVLQVEALDNVITGDFHRRPYAKWQDWPVSSIDHHGKICCEIAREWLTAIDLTQRGGAGELTGPRWIRSRYKWGPSSFPIHWCEAVEKKTLDCGALAALAAEVFAVRGVTVFRAQIVQRFSEVATMQWGCSWGEGPDCLPWTDGDLIYHEACAVCVDDTKMKLWDPSAGWWVDPNQGNGYGSLLALKLTGPAAAQELEWGNLTLTTNEWNELQPR
jgi:hypothetical protein